MRKKLISVLLSVVLVSTNITVLATERGDDITIASETQGIEEIGEEKEGVQNSQILDMKETESEEHLEKSTASGNESEVAISSENKTETQDEFIPTYTDSEPQETERVSEDGIDIQDESEINRERTELKELLETEGIIDSGVIDEDYGHIIWAIDADGKLIVEGTGDFSQHSHESRPWYSNREYITSAIIDVTGMTNASYMFEGCSNLTNLDLGNFDTKNVTDMGGMFYDCISLTSLDLSNFDTKNVTDMGGMFSNCISLTSLDLSSLDTSNVTDMEFMFSECNSLKSLNLSSFDTRYVTYMQDMFHNCRELLSLSLDNFDTRQVTDMGGCLVVVIV